MTNGNDSIAPEINGDCYTHTNTSEIGLTKREYFAAMAMQGIAATETEGYGGDADRTAGQAVSFADALIKELNK